MAKIKKAIIIKIFTMDRITNKANQISKNKIKNKISIKNSNLRNPPTI